MKIAKLFALAGLAGLVLVTTALAQGDAVPSIKKTANKEDKKFQEQVFMTILKAARAKPREPMFDEGKVKKVKEGRKELLLKGHYTTVRGKADVEITIHIDSLDEKAWEVLRIEYKDTNKASPASPSQKNIDKLIPMFNK